MTFLTSKEAKNANQKTKYNPDKRRKHGWKKNGLYGQ